MDHYASDITRTIPVNGKYSPEQKAIYEAVLRVQLACIDYLKPGITFQELHDLSVRLIVQELIELDLLHGDVDELIETKAYFKFYMHYVTHYLGMDCHDDSSSSYRRNWRWTPIEKGVCMTVEPGIYIAADMDGVDPKWWNIGVRIEDDLIVTEDGCEVMSHEAPKEVEEIEKLMAGAKN